MKYEISDQLLQPIVNILSKLPYDQVFQVMGEILKLRPVEEPKIEEIERHGRKETVAVKNTVD